VQVCEENKALIHHFIGIKAKIFVHFSEISLQERFLETSKGILR